MKHRKSFPLQSAKLKLHVDETTDSVDKMSNPTKIVFRQTTSEKFVTIQTLQVKYYCPEYLTGLNK